MIPIKYMVKSRHSRFSNEEDKKLKELVNKHGDKDWIIISSYMPGRNSRQCRERWNNYLSQLEYAAWTGQEEKRLSTKFHCQRMLQQLLMLLMIRKQEV